MQSLSLCVRKAGDGGGGGQRRRMTSFPSSSSHSRAHTIEFHLHGFRKGGGGQVSHYHFASTLNLLSCSLTEGGGPNFRGIAAPCHAASTRPLAEERGLVLEEEEEAAAVEDLLDVDPSVRFMIPRDGASSSSGVVSQLSWVDSTTSSSHEPTTRRTGFRRLEGAAEGRTRKQWRSRGPSGVSRRITSSQNSPARDSHSTPKPREIHDWATKTNTAFSRRRMVTHTT